MSSHERLLFENLRLVLNPKYDVYPQAHLDNIFSVEYQRSYNYYLGYLRKINQKSVDFLIVDRQTQSPAFAIELDDITHELDDRRERDNFVQAVFDKAGLNLIRFNSGQYGAEVLKTVLQKYLI
jgi:very-short-patch-repair endonuclease